MLGSMNSGFERFQTLALINGDGGLVDDGAGVDGGGYPVDGASGVFGSVVVGLLDGVESWKGREQAGVEVDDAALKGFNEWGFQDAEESSENDEVRFPLLDLGDPLLFGFAIEFGFEFSGMKVLGGNAEDGGVGEKGCVVSIRPKGNGFGFTELTGFLGFKDGFGICAGTGTEDDVSHKLVVFSDALGFRDFGDELCGAKAFKERHELDFSSYSFQGFAFILSQGFQFVITSFDVNVGLEGPDFRIQTWGTKKEDP